MTRKPHRRRRNFEPGRLLNPEPMLKKPTKGVLDDAGRKIWERTYDVAKRYYVQERAPEPEALARNCAWKAVMLRYTRQWGGRWKLMPKDLRNAIAGHWPDGEPIAFGQTRETPSPGPVGVLGKLLEVAYLDHEGTFRVQRFGEPGLPDLVWSDRYKSCFAFPHLDILGSCVPLDYIDVEGRLVDVRRRHPLESPRQLAANQGFVSATGAELEPTRHAARHREPGRGVKPPTVSASDVDEAVAIAERWHQRDAQCFRRLETPDMPVFVIGMMDTIVYRSDKWGEPNPHPDLAGSQEYVHQDEYGVVLEMSHVAKGRAPDAVVVHGGKLDAWKEGLVY